jgi:hypothetical protein
MMAGISGQSNDSLGGAVPQLLHLRCKHCVDVIRAGRDHATLSRVGASRIEA